MRAMVASLFFFESSHSQTVMTVLERASRRWTLSSSRFFLESSHSQTVMTVQARMSRRWALSRSRSMFLATLAFQKSTLLFGTTYFEHPLWPCQKQPLMKMTALYFGSTRSGVPGRLRSLSQ